MNLQKILEDHAAWVIGNGGSRANLSNANLCWANLCGANLCGADLCGANLCGANLCGANLSRATIPTGETWEDYLSLVVPALCVAGGVPLSAVAAAWGCHSWANCPMSVAFGVQSEYQCPPLHRPRVQQFVQLFDAGLIPHPDTWGK